MRMGFFHRKNPLVWNAFMLLENRAQAFMACDDIGESRLQRTRIQLSFKTQRQWNVVCCARSLHAIKEPHPLLRIRKRQTLRPALPGHGWTRFLRFGLALEPLKKFVTLHAEFIPDLFSKDSAR